MLANTLFAHPLLFLRIVAIVIVSVTLHELAHGLAALSQGDDTPHKNGHLTLNPLVHMGWESTVFLCVAGIAWGQMPVNPSKFRNPKLSNVLVSAAGPVCNLMLAIGAIVAIRLLDHSPLAAFVSLTFLHLFAQINLALLVFNLLPIPPLDGYHIFSELLPDLKLLETIPYGLFALMVLVLIPDFGSNLAAVSRLMVNATSGVILLPF